MKKTTFALTSLTIAVLAMGCQPKTKIKTVTVEKPEKVYNFTKKSSGTPVDVPVFDPNCTAQRGLGLTNALIDEVYIGVEMVRTDTVIEEDIFDKAKETEIVRETYENTIIDGGHILTLCRDASLVRPNTREGAALAMKASADAAFELYQTVKKGATTPMPTLGKLDLIAAINVKTIERTISKDDKAEEKTSYMVDNAVFMPNGNEPTLVSYPQSETAKKFGLLSGDPLWMVRGVFQHEFGHFVFSSVMNEGNRSFASYQDYTEKNPDLHLFHQSAEDFAHITASPARSHNLANFVLTQDYFLGSLNEGFADLWSYYTLQQPADMFEVSCFTKNRNVGAPAFFNGIAKTWDATLWTKAFDTDPKNAVSAVGKTPTEACAQPNFLDIHIIGAAIAHTADAVFTAAAATNPNRDSSILKAEMAVAWLKALKASEEFEEQGGKASLSRILNTAIGTGINYLKGTDKSTLCSVVSSKFPVLVSRWKNAKTDNEDVSGVVSFCSL